MTSKTIGNAIGIAVATGVTVGALQQFQKSTTPTRSRKRLKKRRDRNIFKTKINF